jgi:5'-methylthioadenosine phosphorylase
MSAHHPNPVLGIIGGSGLYEIDGLESVRWARIDSPFGEASDELLFGVLNGIQLVFLPRHGRGHRYSPSSINYRANIDVLKRAGATDIISLSAVGSLREDLHPGTLVIVDQFVDRTFAREKSFFGTGMVAHVSMAHPVNARLGDWCEQACHSLGLSMQRGGTYLVMEGPQFSTLAESQLYRQWGCDVIGMTNMPEAKLAREAEIPYCTVAMVTDFDCWHPDHDHVDVDAVIRVLLKNADNARALVRAVAGQMSERPLVCPSGDDRALDAALITHEEARDPAVLKTLDAVAGRLLKEAHS